MSERVRVVWDDAIAASYNFGPSHPMAPIRVALAIRLSQEFGLFDLPNVDLVPPSQPCADSDLMRVHSPDLIEAVRRGSLDPEFEDLLHGLGTDDVPCFENMHESAAGICAMSLEAARSVHHGDAEHAVNLAGGLHHGMPDAASGFCVYNDIGVAISWLLDQGVERIAYVDVDVHHGDGVQAMFWDDPRVLTISIHETGAALFPGTGSPLEIGGPNALGYAANIALPPGTGDNAWLRAFHAVVPQLLGAFEPQFLVSQHGCDSHIDDPLAHLALTVDGQRASYDALHRWAHRFAGGRWVAVGGGGYSLVEVVPRAWTHLIAVVAATPIPPTTDLPQGYIDYVARALGRQSPRRMTDGADPWVRSWEAGFDPDEPVDRAVLETRRAVFPHLGLVADPMDLHGF
jgi:acetoin utilization protein AcuC